MIFLDMLRLCTLILASILTSCVFEEGFSEACFVGDSITHMWDLDYYFPSLKIHKHAVSGAGVEDIDKWNLSNCKGVPTVFLMGTNNIGSISIKDADAKDQREAFVRALIPRLKRIEASPLMYTSILPRNYQWKQSPGVNENIDLLNDIVHGILDSIGMEYKYVNAFDAFVDSDNQIRKEFFTDGVHLSAKGYETLTNIVRSSL